MQNHANQVRALPKSPLISLRVGKIVRSESVPYTFFSRSGIVVPVSLHFDSSSAFLCFDRYQKVSGHTWTVHLTYEDRATAPHSASAPASDPCCTTCPKEPSCSAWDSRLQKDVCSRSLLALRMCAIPEPDDESLPARFQVLAQRSRRSVVGSSCFVGMFLI